MRKTLAFFAIALVCVMVSASFASSHLPEERGKKLFENPKFAGGSTACNACHPAGKGLEAAGAKAKFNIMGQVQNGIEEAVNFCIVNANKGKAIAVDSAEMKDMVAFIKSLGKK